MKKAKNRKGFTLAELLIVVAVIAVLVAVAIPTLANQLEKSRQAVDIADLRGAYAAARLGSMDGKVDGVLLETATDDDLTFYYDRTSGELVKTATAKEWDKGYSKGKGSIIYADTSQLPDEAKVPYTLENNAELETGKVIQVTYKAPEDDDEGLYTFTMAYAEKPENN